MEFKANLQQTQQLQHQLLQQLQLLQRQLQKHQQKHQQKQIQLARIEGCGYEITKNDLNINKYIMNYYFLI